MSHIGAFSYFLSLHLHPKLSLEIQLITFVNYEVQSYVNFSFLQLSEATLTFSQDQSSYLFIYFFDRLKTNMVEIIGSRN